MSNSLRRSQSLKNLPGTQKTFATPCGPLVDKRKTVSQLVRQYQSYSDLRDIDSEDQISVPFRTTHEKTHNSSQSISWKGLASAKTGAYSGLTRSVSTDKLPSRHVKGTDALRALFETKSSNNASVKKDKTYQYFPVKDVCSACLKEVYPVEKVVADKCILHMNCFCCKHCKTKLSMHRYSTVYGDFYCTSHYQQLFKRNGNYDEGFGYQQHKDQWLPKKAEPTPETRSSSSAPNCQSTCVDSAAMVQTRISKEDRRVKTKVFQDNVKKLNIAWPPENKGKKKNLPLMKNMSEDSSIKTSRERVHSTNKVHPVQQTRIVKETTKQSLHPLSGMKSKYTGIPFEPKLQFYGDVKRAGSTFQHNKTSKTKTEPENVKSGSKHDTIMNVVPCAVLDGEQRVDEVCSDAICAKKLNENTLCSDDGLTKDDIPPSNNLEERQEGCMTMPQSAIKLNETQCNISDESLSTADVELAENEVCSSLEKKNDAMFANKFNEDTLEMSSRCSNDGPKNNVILSSNYLEELQEGLMSLPPVDVCDGLKKNNHPPSISDDVYIKSDIPNSDNFPKKQERSQSNISTAPNDSSLKTCRSKETPDSSHPDKSYTTDIKHPMKTVNKSTSKGISPISKLFTSGPNEKRNPKHGIKNLPKRVNKLDCLLSKPFYPFTKKEKGLEKTQDTKTIPPEEKKKERTQEDKEKHVEDYEGNKMNTERETFISLPSQDENNSAFSKTDMCDVAAFPKCDPGTLDQTPDNNSNLALCKTTTEDPTASAKEHDLLQENGQNSSQSQTRHHSDIFDPSILETETTADVNVDINISGTENASSELTKDILETPDQKSTKNDIADLIDTNDSQSPIDGKDDNFSPNANIFYPSGFETEVTVEVDVNSNIFTNFVDIFDQESEVTTMTSDQICSQNETSNLADSSSNQSSVAGGNALAYQNDQFSHHADIFNSSVLETRATVEHRVDLNSNIGTNASNHIFDTQNASFENTKFILEMSDYKSTQNDISDLKSTNDSHDDNDSYVAGGNVIDSQNDHFNLNADIFNLSGLETKAVAEIRADVNSNVTTNNFNDILYTDSDVTTMMPDQKCSQNEISDLIDSDANQCSVADGNVLLSQNDIFNQLTDTFYPSGLEMETTDQNITENDISDLISTNQNQSSVVDGNPTHVLDDIFDTASSFSEMSDQKSTQNAVSDQSPVAGGNELASQNKPFTHYADLIDSSGSETEANVEVKIDANSKITLNDIFDVESVSSDQKSTEFYISDQHPVAERNVVGSQNDHFDLFDTDNKKSDLFDENNLPQENSQFVQNDFLDIFSFDHESSTHVINGANQSTAASANKQFIQSEVTDSLCLNEDSSSALWQPSKTHHCPESLECIVFQNADNGADLSTLTLEPSRITSDIFNDSNFGDTVLFEDFTVPSTQTNESISSKDDWLNDFLG